MFFFANLYNLFTLFKKLSSPFHNTNVNITNFRVDYVAFFTPYTINHKIHVTTTTNLRDSKFQNCFTLSLTIYESIKY